MIQGSTAYVVSTPFSRLSLNVPRPIGYKHGVVCASLGTRERSQVVGVDVVPALCTNEGAPNEGPREACVSEDEGGVAAACFLIGQNVMSGKRDVSRTVR
jgi:hypothetical protein